MHITVCNTNPYILILTVVIFASKCIYRRVLSCFYWIKSLAVPLHYLDTFSVIPCSTANEDVISASTRNLPSVLLVTAWMEKGIMNSENSVEKKQDILCFFRSGVLQPIYTCMEDNSTVEVKCALK